MKVIKTENCNMVYRGPEPGIGDLPCERRVMDGHGRTAIFATWALSDADRKAIAEGANVEVGLYYVEPIPPVYVGLTSRQEAKKEPPPGPPNPPRPPGTNPSADVRSSEGANHERLRPPAARARRAHRAARARRNSSSPAPYAAARQARSLDHHSARWRSPRRERSARAESWSLSMHRPVAATTRGRIERPCNESVTQFRA